MSRSRRLTIASALALILCACDAETGKSQRPPSSATIGPAASASDSAVADGAAPTGTTAPGEMPFRAGAPVVDLDGVANLPGPVPQGRATVSALKWVTPVHAKPSRDSKRIGTLRAGAIVLARDQPPESTKRCPEGWQAVEPTGYVCLGADATTDSSQPRVRASSRRPDYAHRLPYMYGTCTRGGPIYARLPDQAQLEQHEPNLAKHMRKWRDDDESGASYGLDVWLRHTDKRPLPAWEAYEQQVSDGAADIPFFLRDGGSVPDLSGLVKSAEAVKIGQVDRRTGRSFVASLLHDGRRYNVTTDLTVIPADRFRPIRGSDFKGWRIPADMTLPFAAVRRFKARKWLWKSKTKRMVDGGKLAWRSAWALTDKKRTFDKKLFYQTREGFYVDDRHASFIGLPGLRKGTKERRWPKWASKGEKWIDINITKQVLLAYEGKTPVYATLVSTGEAGLGDPDESTATVRGIYRIHTKYVAATMDSDVVGEEFELRDVPYVQYFKEGYALHGAYWHDRFGRPKSHGCINLSPEDARRLFWWTGPQVPPRWHSARKSLTGTVVFVHQ